jgi:hypothetical protein
MALLLSLGYHTCLSFDVCMGIGPLTPEQGLTSDEATLQQSRRNDHFSAMLEVILAAYYLILMHDNAIKRRVAALALSAEELKRLKGLHSLDANLADRDDGDMDAQFNPPRYYLQWAELFVFVSVFVATLVNYNWPLDDFFPFYILLTTTLVGWLLYLMMRLERSEAASDDMYMIAPTVPHWPAFVAFLVLGALAVTFFILPETNSSLFHSFWHFFAPLALSALFLSIILEPLEPLFVMDLSETNT